MPSEFRYQRRVQFAETDLAGIVHFSELFRYIEEAEHAMWRQAGLTIAERGSDLGWPRLNAALEFRNPLRFEEEFEVWVRIADIMTRVCVRKLPEGTMRAAEIPALIRDALEAI
jgi:YbgC/YbaW family acyl-CoA thioester hydrolase